ncbi:hypothetical protein ACN27F_30735 [Solwaraspora sp. WMMB335]|uniref:hypothetical protein n=1 Tax=Solwaraspora sp. WMMB335 TaxID=3404118 RepID=UPI003B94E520
MLSDAEQPTRYKTVLIVLALALTCSAAMLSYKIASEQFAEAPRIGSPGTIGIAAETPSAKQPPLDIQMYFDADEDPGRTSVEVSITQIVADSSLDELRVRIFLCGAASSDPRFTDNVGRQLTWLPFPAKEGVTIFAQPLGYLEQCVYTSLPVNASSGSSGFRQALMIGTNGKRPSETSGVRTTYAIPGIAQLPALPKEMDFRYTQLPARSSVTISLHDLPGDLESVSTSPQVADAGRLEWKYSLDPATRPVSNIRLTGQRANLQAARDRNIFIAGGLVGVAGSGLVWFLELSAAEISSRMSRRRKEQVDPDAGEPSLDTPDGIEQAQSLSKVEEVVHPRVRKPSWQSRLPWVLAAIFVAVGLVAAARRALHSNNPRYSDRRDPRQPR